MKNVETVRCYHNRNVSVPLVRWRILKPIRIESFMQFSKNRHYPVSEPTTHTHTQLYTKKHIVIKNALLKLNNLPPKNADSASVLASFSKVHPDALGLSLSESRRMDIPQQTVHKFPMNNQQIKMKWIFSRTFTWRLKDKLNVTSTCILAMANLVSVIRYRPATSPQSKDNKVRMRNAVIEVLFIYEAAGCLDKYLIVFICIC